MLDYRFSIKTSLDEVVTPQTDYRLSKNYFNQKNLKVKTIFFLQYLATNIEPSFTPPHQKRHTSAPHAALQAVAVTKYP